jgi:hypothetical protein
MKSKQVFFALAAASILFTMAACTKAPSGDSKQNPTSTSSGDSAQTTSAESQNGTTSRATESTDDQGATQNTSSATSKASTANSSKTTAAPSSGKTTAPTKTESISNFDMWTNNNFWDTGKVYNETVVLYQQNGKAANGYLMFQPKRIISVKSYDLKKTYVANVDYKINGNVITLTQNSSIPVLLQEDYFPSGANQPNSGPYKAGGGQILYMENSFLVNKQITVTYEYDKSQWKGRF